MYFIQPTRDIPYLDQVLDALPSVQMINIEDLDLYDPTIIAIADVADFLNHQWTLPTIVLAFEHEGAALAQAWQQGALAGWVWDHIPTTFKWHSLKLMRNTNAIKTAVTSLLLQICKNAYCQIQSNSTTIKLKHSSNLQPIYPVIGTITGKSAIKKSCFISQMCLVMG
jgi:hypothetical protein